MDEWVYEWWWSTSKTIWKIEIELDMVVIGFLLYNFFVIAIVPTIGLIFSMFFRGKGRAQPLLIKLRKQPAMEGGTHKSHVLK